ncbi:helicase [Malaciobacter halophilus]|uniref:Helicase n=1 Tax=Malaciobacter halophilus TaxID=197482 RepID=A0A2N1J6E4_9BACT|nr:DEAD/DEAH box helicase [Malaciobacter halophilus]AXH08865.1 DNA/RNA helicase [Malaciobacter halophilus]PKI82094.1 helicase [Malaciobacter halophilus]
MIKIREKLQQLYNQKRSIEEQIKNLEAQLQNKKPVRGFTKDEKIEIFKSLFINRLDIYAKKWVSKDNKKQKYFPVTQTFKKEDYIPLTNHEIELHLRGLNDIATYVIDYSNSCKYVVIELLDEDKFKLQIALNSLNIRAYYEITTYNSLKAWIFFEEKISAKMANLFANEILRRANINGKIFPKEQFATRANLGSFITLPLHLKYRKNNQTVFVDINTSKVYEDQWSVLNSVLKVKKQQIIPLCQEQNIKTFDEASFEDIIFPSFKLKLIIYDFLYIPTKDLSKGLLNKLKSFASFDNPQIKVLLSLRKPLYNTPRVIKNYEEDEKYLKLPRGVIYKTLDFFNKNSVDFILEDKKYFEKIETKKVTFTLRQEQQEAIDNILKKDFSICVAPPGFGKTLIGAKMTEIRACTTLVIVNKNMLLTQWIQRFVDYFGYTKKDIGYLGKGKNKLTGQIDIATMQSLKNDPEVINNYSFLIVDECHHIPAVTFEQIVKQFHGKYVLGLSATPKRKDGLDPILFQQLGDVSYEHKKKKTTTNSLKVIRTDFESQADNYATLINELCANHARNLLILEQIKNNIQRKILVLSDRIEHLKVLEELLIKQNIDYVCIHGSMNKKEQEKNMKEVKTKTLVLATTSYFGEGIDFPHLNTILFATPISYYGRLIQYLGRVGRDGQECLAIDFLDSKNAMLNSAYKKRLEGYKQMHYKQVIGK